MRQLFLASVLYCAAVVLSQAVVAQVAATPNARSVARTDLTHSLPERNAEMNGSTYTLADSEESSSTGTSSGRREVEHPSIEWGPLLNHESLFLATMHSFRIATEPSTREALDKSFFGGYAASLAAMHGWSDGDGYYETYLGHPIQGAVAGYMWVHHDPKYRVVQFGKSRDYWMSRLRAYGWSWAESEQFKIGLISEATIGQIPRWCCGYGFNDHVITNNGGIVWMVGGDILDRYVIRKIEDHTTSVLLRAIVRAGLNPPLTMANLMDLNYPWHRENRAGVRQYRGELYTLSNSQENIGNFTLPIVPKFQLTAAIPTFARYGALRCAGGHGVAGFRLSNSWQWSGDVGGCMLLDMHRGWSGDSLSFLTGPEWIRHREDRWVPNLHFRFGGEKTTEAYCLEYGSLPHGVQPGRPCLSDPSGYAKHYEVTGPSIATGGGLDVQLDRAFDLHLIAVEYAHTWVPRLNGNDFSHGYRLSAGIALKIGTW